MCNLPTEIRIAGKHQITADLNQALFKASKGAFKQANANAIVEALREAARVFSAWPSKGQALEVAQAIAEGLIRQKNFDKAQP